MAPGADFFNNPHAGFAAYFCGIIILYRLPHCHNNRGINGPACKTD
jgi:hypothetical protein